MISSLHRRFSSFPRSLARSASIPAGLLALTGVVFLLAPAPTTQAQGREGRPIGPGVRLIQWTSPAGPHALHAVEVDTSDRFIRLGIAAGRAEGLGLEPLSRQAERLTLPDRYPIAGVNGDFFFYPGTTQPGIPTNALVLGGELIRTPMSRSCLVIAPDGTPSIRILRARGRVTLPSGVERTLDGVNQPRGGNQLVLYTPWFGQTTRTGKDGTEVYLTPEQGQFPLRHGAPHRARVEAVQTGQGGAPIAAGRWVLSGSGAAGALVRALKPGDTLELRVDLDPQIGPEDQVMGGGPRLVRDGKVSVESEGGTLGDAFAKARHPRTAIGFNGKKLYLFVVDGRQPGYSEGMSLYEVAEAMVALGCTEALNMDGGGSSTLWVRGSVANRPSDGRERSVANGLLVFSTAPKSDPVRLIPSTDTLYLLAGAEAEVKVTGEDPYYNPVEVPANQIRWQVDPRFGTVQNGRFTAAASLATEAGQEYQAVDLVAEAGSLRGTVPVRLYPQPARIEILPGTTRLGTLVQKPFRIRAYDREGHLLTLPAGLRWEASPELGTVAADGTLLTGETAGRGTVTVTVNGVAATAQVEVAAGVAAALEDFENTMDWKARLLPAGTQGAVFVAQGKARSGRKALRLDYDFSTATGTRAVYALGSRVLGQPLALKLWVHGDGQGAWLRARIRDGKQNNHLLDLVRKVDWKDSWRELRLPISEDLPGPISLEAIYVVETDPNLKPKGTLLFDDLSVEE